MRSYLPTQTYRLNSVRLWALNAVILIVLYITTACSNTPQLPPTPQATAAAPLPSLVNELTDETLPTLVVAEREASITGNLPLLEILWAEDGRIVDGRGSAQESDDFIWAGRAAILDRYQLAVFPVPPPPLTLLDLANATLSVEGESAILINGVDRWRFAFRDGRWWLQELIYNAP